MKNSYLIYFFLFIAFAKFGSAQNPISPLTQVSGIYSLDNNIKEMKISIAQWKLELKPSGTFTYHFHRQLKGQIVEDFYEKGTYITEELLVTFSNTTENLEEDYIFNFNNTKARVHKKHPRNKSSKKKSVFIHFISSKEIALKGLKL